MVVELINIALFNQFNIKTDDFILFLSDTAKYMVKAGKFKKSKQETISCNLNSPFTPHL